MIVVVIIGILAAIALPNYRQYVIRSNRTAAQAQMLEIANRQQQFLLANRGSLSQRVYALWRSEPALQLRRDGWQRDGSLVPHHFYRSRQPGRRR